MQYKPFFVAFLLVTLNLSTTLVANTARCAGTEEEKAASLEDTKISSSSFESVEIPMEDNSMLMDINAPDPAGDTALIRAIRDNVSLSEKELTARINSWIGQGADVNIPGSGRTTALMHAAQKGYIKVVKHLLKNGANISPTDHYGRTVVYLAIAADQRDVVKYFILQGTDINTHNHNDGTLLMYATEMGFVDIVDLLIELGADINAQDTGGNTALTRAAKEGHTDIVDRLIHAGIQVDSRNHAGKNALACMFDDGINNHSLGIVDRLIMHGSDIHCTDHKNSTTILIKCIQTLIHQHHTDSNNSEHTISVIRRLIDSGINVNASDREGTNALMHCVLYTLCEGIHIDTMDTVLGLLVNAGANINAINPKNNKTALMLIERYRSNDSSPLINWQDLRNRDIDAIAKILKKYGAVSPSK